MTASAANAGALTHKLSSSVQLTVDAAATNVTRLGSTFSISGNGVDTTDGNTANTISVGTISDVTTFLRLAKSTVPYLQRLLIEN